MAATSHGGAYSEATSVSFGGHLMKSEILVRWGWLRFMYVYTAVVAGGFGLAMLVAPGLTRSTFNMPLQEPVTFGMSGSIFLAFGLAAVLGVRAPLKYCPILLVELVYKLIWLCVVVAPLAARGEFPSWAMVQVVIFLTFVVGNLIAIPFRYLFGGDVRPRSV